MNRIGRSTTPEPPPAVPRPEGVRPRVWAALQTAEPPRRLMPMARPAEALPSPEPSGRFGLGPARRAGRQVGTIVDWVRRSSRRSLEEQQFGCKRRWKASPPPATDSNNGVPRGDPGTQRLRDSTTRSRRGRRRGTGPADTSPALMCMAATSVLSCGTQQVYVSRDLSNALASVVQAGSAGIAGRNRSGHTLAQAVALVDRTSRVSKKAWDEAWARGLS